MKSQPLPETLAPRGGYLISTVINRVLYRSACLQLWTCMPNHLTWALSSSCMHPSALSCGQHVVLPLSYFIMSKLNTGIHREIQIVPVRLCNLPAVPELITGLLTIKFLWLTDKVRLQTGCPGCEEEFGVLLPWPCVSDVTLVAFYLIQHWPLEAAVSPSSLLICSKSCDHSEWDLVSSTYITRPRVRAFLCVKDLKGLNHCSNWAFIREEERVLVQKLELCIFHLLLYTFEEIHTLQQNRTEILPCDPFCKISGTNSMDWNLLEQDLDGLWHLLWKTGMKARDNLTNKWQKATHKLMQEAETKWNSACCVTSTQ